MLWREELNCHRPAMTYGLKTYVLTKRQEVQLKMLTFLFKMTRIRNEHIRGRAQV